MKRVGGVLDQAHGLRRMFAAQRQRHIALVHNPHVAFGGLAIAIVAVAERALGLSRHV